MTTRDDLAEPFTNNINVVFLVNSFILGIIKSRLIIVINVALVMRSYVLELLIYVRFD